MQRKDESNFTKRADFPEMLKSGQSVYCFVCGEEQPRRQTKCDFCGIDSGRSLVWDDSIKQYFNEKDFLVHESTGAFVINNDGAILLIDLNKFPFGHTIPAGHVNVTENSSEACVREIKEEVGLDVQNLEMVYQGEIWGDSCSRGADIHMWTFYAASAVAEKIFLNEESKSYKWLAVKDFPNDLTYPVSFCLNQDGVPKIISNYIKKLRTD